MQLKKQLEHEHAGSGYASQELAHLNDIITCSLSTD